MPEAFVLPLKTRVKNKTRSRSANISYGRQKAEREKRRNILLGETVP